MAYRDNGKDNLGAPIWEPVKDPDVVEFLRLNRLNFQWIDLIGSLEIFANGWLEFILNKGQDRINKVFVKDPAYCRNGKIDSEHPVRIPWLFYSAQWDSTPSETMVPWSKYPCSIPESTMATVTRIPASLTLSFTGRSTNPIITFQSGMASVKAAG